MLKYSGNMEHMKNANVTAQKLFQIISHRACSKKALILNLENIAVTKKHKLSLIIARGKKMKVG